MLTVATCLWAPTAASFAWSRDYDEAWVERLQRNFARHLTVPHKFAAFVDRRRAFLAPVHQFLLAQPPGYGSMIEPFKLEGPMIVVGLDTVVTGNIDHLAEWCERPGPIALPKSPGKDYACNGVALVPPGNTGIYDHWRGENDMEWLRAQPHVFIDDLWPGQVVSYKCDVRPNGLGNARIVYFHGPPKADELMHLDWVRENWV